MRRNKFFSLPITALILLLGMFQDLAFAAGPHTIEKDGWQNGIPTWHWPMETKLCAKVEGAGKKATIKLIMDTVSEEITVVDKFDADMLKNECIKRNWGGGYLKINNQGPDRIIIQTY